MSLQKKKWFLFLKIPKLKSRNPLVSFFLGEYSQQPLRVQVASYFMIKQETLMTYFGIIIDNAIMMLLSF